MGGACMHQQTLRGSFLAVPKPHFATKYSFISISNYFRNLQDFRTSAPLQTQQIDTFRQHSFGFFDEMFTNVDDFLVGFVEFLTDFDLIL